MGAGPEGEGKTREERRGEFKKSHVSLRNGRGDRQTDGHSKENE